MPDFIGLRGIHRPCGDHRKHKRISIYQKSVVNSPILSKFLSKLSRIAQKFVVKPFIYYTFLVIRLFAPAGSFTLTNMRPWNPSLTYTKKDRTFWCGPLISIGKPDHISCGSSRVLSAMSFLQRSTNLSRLTPGTCLLEPLTLTATVFSAASLSPTTRM